MPIPTILVEDSPKIRDALIPTMQEISNMEVVALAATASEAKQALADFPLWRVIVVDLFLREGSGLEVLRACEKRNADQHALVLSNYATPDMRRRCMELGANRVFDKSTELDAFFDYCAEHLHE